MAASSYLRDARKEGRGEERRGAAMTDKERRRRGEIAGADYREREGGMRRGSRPGVVTDVTEGRGSTEGRD